MRIAVLGTRGFPKVQGGVETHCENLYPLLVDKGCEVIVFTRKPYVDIAIDQYKGVKFVHLSCLKNKYLEAFLHTFYGVLVTKIVNPDILHIHAIGPSLFVPLARILGLKVVMTNHGPDYQRKKWKKPAKSVLRLGEKFGSRWANAIICISRQIAEDIKRKYGRDSAIIPNGVIMPQISKSDDVLREFDLVEGKYVLSVGRLVPEKGFHDLMDAFNLLQLEDWKLVVVGRADHKDNYSLGLSEEARMYDDVILTGFLTGKPLKELYTHAGLFVLPSYYEGLPIALLEAMSYGLSCIVSDIPANREVGLPEERFFKVGDTQALAEKIKRFISSPLSEEERNRQISQVAARYDWEKVAEQTLGVYRKVYEHKNL